MNKEKIDLDFRSHPQPAMPLAPGSLFFNSYSRKDNEAMYNSLLNSLLIVNKLDRRAITEGCPQISKFLVDVSFSLRLLLDSLEHRIFKQSNNL